MKLTPHANYAAAAAAARVRSRHAERAAKEATWRIASSAVAFALFAVMAIVNFGWAYLLGCGLFGVLLWLEVAERRTQADRAEKERSIYETYARAASDSYPENRSAR